MDKLKSYGLFLLGENSRQEITVEDYKKYCERHEPYYIGAFIIDDMSDKKRSQFWDKVSEVKKKENLYSILLNEYVLLIYKIL